MKDRLASECKRNMSEKGSLSSLLKYRFNKRASDKMNHSDSKDSESGDGALSNGEDVFRALSSVAGGCPLVRLCFIVKRLGGNH